MAVALMRHQLMPLAGAVVVLVMAVLMVSRLRLPEIQGRSVVTVMMVVGIFNYLALVAWPSWSTVIWWNVWNLAIYLAARREDRHLATDLAAEQTG
jgi:hypothetical protein